MPVPVQAPDQPLKVEPAAGVAVRVTLVPEVKSCEQVEPQLIPAGLDVTVPLPEPALLTLSVAVVGVGVPRTPTQGWNVPARRLEPELGSLLFPGAAQSLRTTSPRL
ncbi:MAG TPA: hypothetical protein VGK69_04895, partial [Gaiellaceae bacterium]